VNNYRCSVTSDTVNREIMDISVVLLSTDELSISKSCYICLKKLKIDFVDILNVLLHKVLSNYKLECPGKNTPGTKESTSTPKRGKYQIMSPVERAEIGKYASQHSTPQTIAHFKSRFNCPVSRYFN
jgi:hypothetical protein